ncbi:MAG: hypothetical protein ACOYMN_15865, partial [Roseimicrobium sp.]
MPLASRVGSPASSGFGFLAALLMLATLCLPAQATEPDTFSKVVSYQYLDSLDEPGSSTQAISKVVSYQYLDSLDESGTNTPVMSKVVSYQYLDSLDEPGSNTQVMSPVVSYQYYDWLGDDVLASLTSAPVSFDYRGSAPLPSLKLTQITISGPASLDPGVTGVYFATGHFVDGTKADIT